jgi:PAS domain S-box-containing protein
MALLSKILIIDDDEDDYIIMKHYLSKIDTFDYDVYWCNRFEDALLRIRDDEHDIYLIDQFLGKGEGIEIIDKARKEGCKKPLILLTGASNRSIDRKAMEVGASDYLIKNEIRVDTLERALRYASDRYAQSFLVAQQEKKYRSLFELSSQALLLLDESLNITEFNHAFRKLFQRSNHTLPEKLSDLFLFSYDLETLSSKLKSEGFVKDFKTVLLKEKAELVVIISVVRLPYLEGASCYQLIMQDISKLLEAEKEVQRLEKLSLSSRMARIIAHEVRNPLTNINLALGELNEVSGNNEDVVLYNDLIKRNAKRIADLIDQLLYSTKTDELQIVYADLKDIAIAAFNECKDRLSLMKVNVIEDYPSSPVMLKCDPEKLKIAFVNIIINGVEAMDEQDNPTLKFSIKLAEEALLVQIKDNGRGMDEETVKHIFDPFFTKRNSGLGLGMTATLSILSRHNVSIKIDSKEGVGTLFNLIF